MVRDKAGRKMSKSLGNVIDPLHVINGITLEQLLADLQVSAAFHPRWACSARADLVRLRIIGRKCWTARAEEGGEGTEEGVPEGHPHLWRRRTALHVGLVPPAGPTDQHGRAACRVVPSLLQQGVECCPLRTPAAGDHRR